MTRTGKQKRIERNLVADKERKKQVRNEKARATRAANKAKQKDAE